MKSVAVFPKSKDVKLIDHSEPAIQGPADIKIKVREVGVCGTDREIWNFEYGDLPVGSDYLITGHEAFGEVVEVGNDVRDLKPGDLVVPTVRRPCPDRCVPCAGGAPDFCFTGRFRERGIKQAHGFMAEYVVEERSCLTPVPLDMADVAVLLEPLSVTEKAISQTLRIQTRLPWECRLGEAADDRSCRNAIILGAGPVGLLAAMTFRHLGLRVVVVARSPAPNPRSVLLASMGIAYRSTREATPSQIAAELGNVDIILEATGAAKVSFDFLQTLGANGVFIFTGIPGRKKEVTLDAAALMREMVLKNQVVLGTVNAPKEAFEVGVRHLRDFKAKWPDQVRSLITHRFPLERFHEIRDEGASSAIKMVLVP